jgi:hypothetical protein
MLLACYVGRLATRASQAELCQQSINKAARTLKDDTNIGRARQNAGTGW